MLIFICFVSIVPGLPTSINNENLLEIKNTFPEKLIMIKIRVPTIADMKFISIRLAWLSRFHCTFHNCNIAQDNMHRNNGLVEKVNVCSSVSMPDVCTHKLVAYVVRSFFFFVFRYFSTYASAALHRSVTSSSFL